MLPRSAKRSTATREEPMSGPKPFEISKEMVGEAYRRVKANRGAAGIDGETIEEYGRNLKGNLHKLWNRMSSGATSRRRCGWSRYRSQADGASGCWECPQWRTGSRKPSSSCIWSPKWSLISTRTPTATDRGDRRWTRWRAAVGEVRKFTPRTPRLHREFAGTPDEDRAFRDVPLYS